MVVLKNIKAFVAGINPPANPIAVPIGAAIYCQRFLNLSLNKNQEARWFCLGSSGYKLSTLMTLQRRHLILSVLTVTPMKLLWRSSISLVAGQTRDRNVSSSFGVRSSELGISSQRNNEGLRHFAASER